MAFHKKQLGILFTTVLLMACSSFGRPYEPTVITLKGHKDKDELRSVNFSADGKQLVTTSYPEDEDSDALNGIAMVWDTQTGQSLFRVESAWFRPAYFRDGKLFIATPEKTVKVLDQKTGQLLFTLEDTDLVHPDSFSPRQ